MLCARAVPHEHPSQRTLRFPASCARRCHGALGIVRDHTTLVCRCWFLLGPLGAAPALRNTRNQFEVSLQGGLVCKRP
jgi:hypothetical protein